MIWTEEEIEAVHRFYDRICKCAELGIGSTSSDRKIASKVERQVRVLTFLPRDKAIKHVWSLDISRTTIPATLETEKVEKLLVELQVEQGLGFPVKRLIWDGEELTDRT
jgi:hypothetical protein